MFKLFSLRQKLSLLSITTRPGLFFVNLSSQLLCKTSAGASNYMLRGQNLGPSVSEWPNLFKDATEILIRPHFSFMIPVGRHEYEDKVRYAEDVKKSNSSYD